MVRPHLPTDLIWLACHKSSWICVTIQIQCRPHQNTTKLFKCFFGDLPENATPKKITFRFRSFLLAFFWQRTNLKILERIIWILAFEIWCQERKSCNLLRFFINVKAPKEILIWYNCANVKDLTWTTQTCISKNAIQVLTVSPGEK